MLASVAHRNMAITQTKLNYATDNPVMDEFTRGCCKPTNEGEITIWFVFACRILLDIQDVLGAQVKHAWEQYYRTSIYAKADLKLHRDEGGQLENQGEPWPIGPGAEEVPLFRLPTR